MLGMLEVSPATGGVSGALHWLGAPRLSLKSDAA